MLAYACRELSYHWKPSGGDDWAGQLTVELKESQPGVFDPTDKEKA